jgi:hypothetical protein
LKSVLALVDRTTGQARTMVVDDVTAKTLIELAGFVWTDSAAG